MWSCCISTRCTSSPECTKSVTYIPYNMPPNLVTFIYRKSLVICFICHVFFFLTICPQYQWFLYKMRNERFLLESRGEKHFIPKCTYIINFLKTRWFSSIFISISSLYRSLQICVSDLKPVQALSSQSLPFHFSDCFDLFFCLFPDPNLIFLFFYFNTLWKRI